MLPRGLIAIAISALAAVAPGCGGSEDPTSTEASSTPTTTTTSESTTTTSESTTTTTSSTTTTPTEVPTSGCAPVETVDVETSGTHFNRDFTAADYETNPPTGGAHNPTPLVAGKLYSKPPRLGEAVHLLEHGAVIAWTKDLPSADQKLVEKTLDGEYSKGYYQLAVVENPDLDVPFALSSWGALQQCGAVDPAAIRSFVEKHYAPSTTAEGSLACTGKAGRLPACRALKP